MEVAPGSPPREARMLPVVIVPVKLPDAPALETIAASTPPIEGLGFAVVITEAIISPFSSLLMVIVSFCKAVPRSDILTICFPTAEG